MNRQPAIAFLILSLVAASAAADDNVAFVEPAANENAVWRTVRGSFVWPEGAEAKPLNESDSALSLVLSEAAEQAIIEQTPFKDHCPAGYSDWSPEEREAWFKTPACEQAQLQWNVAMHKTRLKLTRHQKISVGSDGAFTASQVKPGVYSLYLTAYERDANIKSGRGGRIAKYYSTEIVVPPIDHGTNTTHALGRLEITPLHYQKALRVGDRAYAFEAPLLGSTADAPLSDKTVRLADLRGKVVLMPFWGAGCLGCRQEAPELKAVWEQYGEDERFAMLGLSVDPNPEQAIEMFVDHFEIEWPNAYLGKPTDSKTFNDYGAKGIPSVWLIGPDGTVLARDLRGRKAISTAIEAAFEAL